MEQIACKKCDSHDCHGCNLLRLEQMLNGGKLDSLMDEKRGIKTESVVRPVAKAKWEDVHIDRPEIADLEVASMFCPNCNRWHNEVYHYGNPIEFANFCSFCGADMREGE